MPRLDHAVISLVRSMAPDYEYRWTDAVIEQAVYLADLAVCEATEMLWSTHDITLVNGQAVYDLPADITWIKNVQYNRDGINFETVLQPASTQDFDEMSNRWQDDTGFPTHFALLSQPGVEGYSKIIIWRWLPTVSGQQIRVNYLRCRSNPVEAVTADAPPAVIQSVYLPYVLGLLRSGEEPEEAEGYMAQYRIGLAKVTESLTHRAGEPMTRLEMRP